MSHRVLWYAEAFDFGDLAIDEAFPDLAGRSGVSAISRAFANIFVGHAPQRVADLPAVLASDPVDAMLCDGLMYGVGLVHELGGPGLGELRRRTAHGVRCRHAAVRAGSADGRTRGPIA